MNKQQKVHRALRERILDGRYGPGYRLVIDALASEFGMSSLPVREAIRRLEAEGLVMFEPNVGARVTPADPSLYHEEMTAVAVLEGYATALAAPRLDDERFAALEGHTDRMEECLHRMDVLGFASANHAFHEAIFEACPNRSLVEMLVAVGRRLDAIRRTVFTHIPYRGLESVREHHALMDLMRSGAEFREIEMAAREHKLKTARAFLDWQRSHEDAAAPSRGAPRPAA